MKELLGAILKFTGFFSGARRYYITLGIMTVLVGCSVGLIAGRYKSRANVKEILITNLDDYKAYEALDREQAGYLAQSQQLQIMFNVAKEKKAAIQARIGAPKDFVEKREDDKNPQSPVIAFVEPLSTTAPKQ